MSKFSKGFGIIELIIVIVIIIALAGTVSVELNKYANKSNGTQVDQTKDVAIEADLDAISVNGPLFYATNQNYDNFCASQGVFAAQSSIVSTGANFNCSVSADKTQWCACSTLIANSGSVFCVDSARTKKTVSSIDCDSECPSSGACK